MPGRALPFINDEIYHVYNRGINHCPTFTCLREYRRAIDTLKYYRLRNPQFKFSRYIRLSNDKKTDLELYMMNKHNKLVSILAYNLMPNHFHLLIKQLSDNGIPKFLGNFENSYTKFFNIRNDRDGSLFLDQFKAKLITNEEQFLHVSRYIHLNEYSSHLVKSLKDLENYPWSSFKEYSSPQDHPLCDTEMILSLFKNKISYRDFVFDQADYQRKLENIKHLVME